MIGLNFSFWTFVILFGLIGGMRGWAKELLVTFGMILALFILTVLEKYIPFVRDGLANTPETLFWMRTSVVVALVFFGYQSPNIGKLAGTGRFARERLQDALLGLFLGAINGFLIFGTIWFYLNEAGYPFPEIIPPADGTASGEAAKALLPLFAPAWLGTPMIYFAVAISFAFVLVVFL
jgi:hypothetical protein